MEEKLTTMPKAVFIGEAMVELSRRDSGGWNIGYGGDTLNTAVHMARSGINAAYLTAMGNDPFSEDLCTIEWPGEGLDMSLVIRHPTRSAGLYSITTDTTGERSFTYWRGESAARDMFALPEIAAALHRAENADLLCFSLITLAILPPEGRDIVFALAKRVRANGGKVAFDGNYRPRLWGSVNEAIIARDEAIGCSDIGLPTLEDEMQLSGEKDADAVARHWIGLGCPETIVKLGAAGCQLPDGNIIAPPEALSPVDTSGAGDAFNGGYLAARLRGESPANAALAGHSLAGWCIMRRGAIPQRDDAAPY
jgi:2-dehydro-3-deoxygluconokinase